MPRPKRKKIELNEEGVNNLLQEIYNDSHNIRAQIKRLYTKWETKAKEEGHIAAFGDQIVKLIAAEAKNQDQKIMLLKYLKEIVFDKNKKVVVDEDNKEVTPDDRNELIKMVSKELEEKKANEK